MAVSAERVAESPWVERLARIGLIAQGLSFMLVGALAGWATVAVLLVFRRFRHLFVFFAATVVVAYRALGRFRSGAP